MKKKDILILGIETSCDETSAAVVKNGRDVLSNIISSQIEIHKRFGGVVPEVASRNHIMAIDSVVSQALEQANVTFNDIDAIAVTYGAGLIGALMVGVSFAKTLAFALNKPLIAVNHIQGHVAANYLGTDLKPPFTALVVSGGHTAIIDVKNYCSFKMLGNTLDDAIGEAFDKVARVLGLNYPGGPEIDRLAKEGKPIYDFSFKNNLKDELNSSYSGLKTSVINFVHSKQQKNEEFSKADVAASFQKLATDMIVEKSVNFCSKTKAKTLVIAGGVSANSGIRQCAKKLCEKQNISLFIPKMAVCTDNGAMIAAQGYYNFINNKGLAGSNLSAKSRI